MSGGATEMRKLVRAAERAGCVARVTGSCHWRIETPQGPVFASWSPSDTFALAKVRRDLRRKGVIV